MNLIAGSDAAGGKERGGAAGEGVQFGVGDPLGPEFGGGPVAAGVGGAGEEVVA